MAKRSTSSAGPTRRKFTPAEVAAAWGVTPEKVIAWIRSGELKAINAAASSSTSRPRYLIDQQDLEAFEALRSIVPHTKTRRRGRRTKPDVQEYF